MPAIREGVIEGGQQRIFADPGRKARAEIVQAVEDPGSGSNREDTAGA